MKAKYYAIVAGIFMSFLAFSGCSDDDPEPEPSAPSTYFKANVDSQSWASTSAQWACRYNAFGSSLTLGGMSSDSMVIEITLSVSGGTPVDSYPLASFTSSRATYHYLTNVYGNWSTTTNGSSGSVVITAFDTINKRISGRFAFHAYGFAASSWVTVQGGTFSIPYTTDDIPESFHAKVDGANITYSSFSCEHGVNPQLEIHGEDAAGEHVIDMFLPLFIMPGTYPIGSWGDPQFAYYYDGSMTTESSSGTVTITSHNWVAHTVKGSFNFTAEPTFGGPPFYQITNGTFELDYFEY